MAETTGGYDASEYGGRYSGFEESSPYYTPPNADQNPGGSSWYDYAPSQATGFDFSSGGSSSTYTPPELNFDNMDTDSANNMAEGNSFMDSSFGKRLRNFLNVDKGSSAYNWGLRTPGTEEARNFFGTETGGERNTRMSNVGGAIQGLSSMFTPAPVRAVMAAHSTFKGGGGLGDYMKALAPALGGNLGRAVGTGISISDGNYGRAFQQAVGGQEGALGGMAIDAASGRDVRGPVASTVGSYLGNQVAGPMGGAAGSFLARQVMQPARERPSYPGIAGPTGSPPTAGGIAQENSNYNSLGQLFGMYNNYRQSEAAKESASAMKANLPDLNALFGPGSAAYTNLQKELDAKDAASGRRSQYGQRAVELASRMATLQGQYGASFANANANAEQMALKARQDGMAREAQMLNNLFQVGKNMGVPRYLNDMFGGNSGGGGGMPSTNSSDKPYLYGDEFYG